MYTEDRFPQQWAGIQFELGLLYEDFARTSDGRQNLKAALAYYLAAERGYTACGAVWHLANARKGITRVRGMLDG